MNARRRISLAIATVAVLGAVAVPATASAGYSLPLRGITTQPHWVRICRDAHGVPHPFCPVHLASIQ